VAKRRKLIASRWYDFIPSLALIIAYLVYITIGLSLGEVLLSLIAFFTSLPVLLRLVFLYLNREEKE
jgi:ABC-type transport system involved in cytochrome c biogenesis permease component